MSKDNLKIKLLYILIVLTTIEVSGGKLPPKEPPSVFVTPNTNNRTERPKQKHDSISSLAAKQDTKASVPQGSRDDLQSSSTEVKRAAKSPLVLKLLQERQQEDISNQLAAYAAVSQTQRNGPIAYAAPEQEAVYYQQESPEYAEAEKETPSLKEIGSTKPARYQYIYKVKDPEGNDFGHSETRVGDKTWGRYFVQLPDGREKTVRYWADDTGFHAEVQYKGHAAHPSGGKKLEFA